MSHFLTEEELVMRNNVREFVDNELRPAVTTFDKADAFPSELYQRCAELGLTGIMAPEEYGGLGGNFSTELMVLEEIGRVWPTLAIALEVSLIPILTLMDEGTEEQKAKYIPPLVDGRGLGGLSIAEASGSINYSEWPFGAKKVDGGYLVNCTKVYQTSTFQESTIHNSIIILWCKTEEGIIKFIVPMDSRGIEKGEFERKLGLHGSETGNIYFKDVFVPYENVIATDKFDFAPIAAMGALALGAAQEAFDRTFEYLQNRTKAGKPIITINGIGQEMAKIATELEMARSFVYGCGRMYDEGQNIDKYACMVKAWTTEFAVRVLSRCVVLNGSPGYTEDYGICRVLRDIQGYCLAELPTDVLYAMVQAHLGIPEVVI